MAAGGQKICDALYLWFTDKKAPRTNRPLYVRLMGSRQNLAWTYYLTLGTTPRKNFSFFSKSKMAAAAITANYEIAHNLKSIQLRDPIFFPIPMFSRVRNAMKLSFAFYDLSNYLKFQNGRRNWRFQTYSRGVILLVYDHSNYLKIMWELQIDVSIIYSFLHVLGYQITTKFLSQCQQLRISNML